MSSTGRKDGKRLAADAYSTPSWVTRLILDAIDLPAGRWLEPCAGDGAVIRAGDRDDVSWTACEIRSECGPLLAELPLSDVYLGDFLALADQGQFSEQPYDVVLTNPPYSLAEDFVNACLPLARHVVFLLRLNFLGGAARAAFWHDHMPDVYVLPNRPSFTGRGTDSTEYAWYHWHGAKVRREGHIRVLPALPISMRKS